MAKLKSLNKASSMSGCSTVNSVIRKATSATAEIAKQVRMYAEVHPPVFHEEFPLERANKRKVRDTDMDTKPTRSKERTLSILYSRSMTIVAIIATMPTGTFTSKIA